MKSKKRSQESDATRAEAEDICRNRPGEDIMWPVPVIDAIASRQADSQDLPKANPAAHD